MGSAAGGGFDIYSRALARHWGKFIPGHPTIVVRNMPGAGGARSAAYVSTVAPKDGTVLAAPMPGAIVGPLLDDNSQTGFDPAKLQYLGTADSGVRVCVTMDKSKVRTFADALTTKAIMGATAGRRLVERLRLSAPPHVGRQVRCRVGLSGHERYQPGDGARRARRHLRMGLVEPQVDEAGLDQGQADQHPVSGRPPARS